MKKNIFSIALASGLLLSSVNLPLSASATTPEDNTVKLDMLQEALNANLNITNVTPEMETYASGAWIPAESIKGSTKLRDMSTKYVAIALAGTITYAVAGPAVAALTPVAAQIVSDATRTVWYKSTRSFRMAGATLQIKYVYTTYKDSKFKKKIKSATWITNDMGGKSLPTPEDLK